MSLSVCLKAHTRRPHVPGVVDLVDGDVVGVGVLQTGRGRLQLPVVQAVQEHLGQVVHRLPLLLGQVTELVQHKVGHTLKRIKR